jgi:hypothetical protein
MAKRRQNKKRKDKKGKRSPNPELNEDDQHQFRKLFEAAQNFVFEQKPPESINPYNS